MNQWIDFKELRTKRKFSDVLRFYGIELKQNGPQLLGPCPLPKHEGKATQTSFSVNEERGIFQCFSCKARGNVLDFAGFMEGVDIRDGVAMRKAAQKLQTACLPGTVVQNSNTNRESSSMKNPAADGRPILINEPLDFELKGLDAKHPYLLDRGYLPETIAHFGIGVATRGFLQGRLAIPLHDEKGKLIGYAGRLIDGTKVTADNPQLLLPKTRERAGTVREFDETQFVYNGFRMKEPVTELLVVEGVSNVWWLHQNGYPRTVGLLGADCSVRQGHLLTSLLVARGRLWIVPGSDSFGNLWKDSVLKQVASRRFCRCAELANGRHPGNLTKADFSAIFLT